MSALTPHQQFLAARTEEAVHDGDQLARWLRETDIDAVAFPLDLGKPFRLPNRATGFFGNLTINGQPTSVMGCRQRIDFPGSGGATARDLVDFMAAEFLPRAHWTNPDGAPGGFTVTQSIYKTTAGALGVFQGADQDGCADWRRLGRDLEWVLLTVNIHDFVMDFGPFQKRFREAACVAPHSRFMRIVEGPGQESSVTVGYPFVRFAPIPNVFGFGPGKFGTAIKLFTLILDRSGSVRAQMDFAAAPRCQKVFDFGDSIPDPVYGGARLLEKLTFGLFKAQPLRDRMDTQMLAQHCRVHQSLMDGVENVWREWLKQRASSAGERKAHG